MRSITIFCDGGLGNRFGTLIGGLITAQYFGIEPIICWPENTWCGCSFDDLFETNFKIINDDINKLFNDNHDKIFLIHENQTNQPLKKIYQHTPQDLNIIKSMSDDIVYYNNQISDFWLPQAVFNKLASLKIKTDILEVVKKFTTEYGITKETKGLHFRKTDVPREYINEDKTYQYIVENSEVKFFICSDDKNTEMKFNMLKNTIIYSKTQYVEKLKEGGWNDLTKDNEGREFNFNVNRPKQSVIEAFIDLLLLSRTEIMVNNESSFLTFAKLYSNINF